LLTFVGKTMGRLPRRVSPARHGGGKHVQRDARWADERIISALPIANTLRRSVLVFVLLVAWLSFTAWLRPLSLPGMRWPICAIFAVLVAGCAHNADIQSKKAISLQIGMSRQQVEAVMGYPRLVETRDGVEFWVYPPDESETGEALPVGFVNGRVTGWGRMYYEEAADTAVAADGSIEKRK
jgi:hypothetical protein